MKEPKIWVWGTPPMMSTGGPKVRPPSVEVANLATAMADAVAGDKQTLVMPRAAAPSRCSRRPAARC